MTEKSVSSEVVRQLGGLARRLHDNPHFMAHVLAAYQRQEHVGDAELAERLNTTTGMLSRLALCRRPSSDSPDFSAQIHEIAAYTSIDAAGLAAMVRQVDSLQSVAQLQAAPGTEKGREQQMELRPGLLAAARDHADAEDQPPTAADDEATE